MAEKASLKNAQSVKDSWSKTSRKIEIYVSEVGDDTFLDFKKQLKEWLKRAATRYNIRIERIRYNGTNRR